MSRSINAFNAFNILASGIGDWITVTHLRSGSLVLTLQNFDEDLEGTRRGDCLL